ncbi:LacI family DNA-binding transcriptional regulator [Subtercola sp. YIM 133946]|uniref:LacI family DNA-binding transcriptional regulator n=1 Tax=Subtercola sp. YIM 133946 TaxID=3118909 RepID=UPI002F93034E
MKENGSDERSVRMIDVARLAGVSHQTVSRVVNNHPSVSPEVRERVETAIRRLRYRRHSSARALASNRSLTIGVVSFGLAQYGPSVILTGVVDEAKRAGYSTSLVTVADPDRDMTAAVDHLLAVPVDGIVIVAPIEAALRSARTLHVEVPIVVFEPGADHTSGNVVTDEVSGSAAATQYLLDLGHQTVHHIAGPAGWLGTAARIAGWTRSLEQAGVAASPAIAGDWTTASGYRAGLVIADDPEVTAVFVANDQMALGVIKALADRGIDVPGDVSVLGFDDVPESSFFRPALSTMHIDFDQVGRYAVTGLVSLITGHSDRVDRGVLPVLVERQSTGPPSGQRGQRGTTGTAGTRDTTGTAATAVTGDPGTPSEPPPVIDETPRSTP